MYFSNYLLRPYSQLELIKQKQNAPKKTQRNKMLRVNLEAKNINQLLRIRVKNPRKVLNVWKLGQNYVVNLELC